ncbi:alpha/beta fold hydrolase [Rhodovulum sp. DZ06]|uniref:alpha/beta fold hydrolase n=1 Tax=Rhodovulum sp. DZ06 TaxID=3425126 RepID=UPI003D3350C1
MPEAAILVHGAWAGPWVWDRFAPLLEAAGIRTVAVDLRPDPDMGPGEDPGLPQQLARIEAALDALGGQAALIGHSGGGVAISAAAEAFPERISRLVYVAGMMLPSGMGFADLLAAEDAAARGMAGIGPHLNWTADGAASVAPPEAAMAIFFNDCPAEVAETAAHRLTPQPEAGRALAATLTPARFGRVPRLYVIADEDRAVRPEMQRRMIELSPGAEVLRLPTGHAPQLSAPDLLAEAILPFLADPGAEPTPVTQTTMETLK